MAGENLVLGRSKEDDNQTVVTDSPIRTMSACIKDALRLEDQATSLNRLNDQWNTKIAQGKQAYQQEIAEIDRRLAKDRADHQIADIKKRGDAKKQEIERHHASTVKAVMGTSRRGSLGGPRALPAPSTETPEQAMEHFQRQTVESNSWDAKKARSWPPLQNFFTGEGWQYVIAIFFIGPILLCCAVCGIYSLYCASRYSAIVGMLEADADAVRNAADAEAARGLRQLEEQLTTETAACELALSKLETVAARAKADAESRWRSEEVRLKEQWQLRSQESKQAILSGHQKLLREVEALNTGGTCGSWNDVAWSEWMPADQISPCLRMGSLLMEMPRFEEQFSPC